MSTLQTPSTADRTDWFVHDRFGLFIHWGLYAAPARHEWVKSREKTTDADPTTLMLQLPVQRPPVAVPVIELFFEGLGALLQGAGVQLYAPTQYARGQYHVSMRDSRC